jgi:hypothetical protein
MTTLAEIVLKVAREVTDVMDGAATSGATTSLTDITNLIQPNQYWDRGTLFIKSGTHTGKALPILGYSSSKVTFTSLGLVPVAVNDRYALMRGVYPWNQIVTAIVQALDSTHVTGTDATLTGDGSTLEFTIPTGVYNIKRVEFIRDSAERLVSNHWREVSGKLRFDYGYAPFADDVINIVYRAVHPDLALYSDTISNEINLEWLKYKAAEQLLWWGIGMYGQAQEYRIEERMNKILTALKGKAPRRDAPDIMVNTASIYQ